MSDKVRWAGIYLSLSCIPIVLYLLPPLSKEIITSRIITEYLVLLPYAGLLLIAILGWQVNQTRIFWTALLYNALYYFFIHGTGIVPSQVGRAHAIEIVTVACPLALTILFSFRESLLWSDQSLTRVLLALSPFGIFLCLYSWTPDVYQDLFFWSSQSQPHTLLIPRFAFGACSVFLLLSYFLPDAKVKYFLIALGTTLVPLLISSQVSLKMNADPDRSTEEFDLIISFGIITIILLHSILRMYWQKVYLDILTGVPNRQALDERLGTLQERYTIAMIDIDHFKKFNDTHGHAEGDNVLRMVAQQLKEHLGERVYRYGGEEFCVVFEKEDSETAYWMMERTRVDLAKREFYLRTAERDKPDPDKKSEEHHHPKRGATVQIHISAGMSSHKKRVKSYTEVIQKADQALYEAKAKGRNQVISTER